MRHRGDAPQPRTAFSSETGTTSTIDENAGTRSGEPGEQPTVGKHKAPVTPLIPKQKEPHREPPEAPERGEATPAATSGVAIPVPATAVPAPVVEPVAEDGATEPDEPAFVAPHTARWRASHGPRMLAGVLLVLAVGGTSALGLDYQQNPGSDQLISLAIGIAVVIGLWAMLIASTPQAVSLRGSVLTIHNSSGTERFDLGDGQQSVDLVGEPHSSKWALVLHRANRTTLVLRRRDVDAVQLDPIVRHYRTIAHRTYSERQARFER